MITCPCCPAPPRTLWAWATPPSTSPSSVSHLLLFGLLFFFLFSLHVSGLSYSIFLSFIQHFNIYTIYCIVSYLLFYLHFFVQSISFIYYLHHTYFHHLFYPFIWFFMLYLSIHSLMYLSIIHQSILYFLTFLFAQLFIVIFFSYNHQYLPLFCYLLLFLSFIYLFIWDIYKNPVEEIQCYSIWFELVWKLSFYLVLTWSVVGVFMSGAEANAQHVVTRCSLHSVTYRLSEGSRCSRL